MIGDYLKKNRPREALRLFWKFTGMRKAYMFASSQGSSNHSKLAEQKAARQMQIDHRKKMMEEHQLRIVRDKIQNTKGNFNPFLAYLKLYRSFFIKLAFLLGLTLAGGFCFQMVGVDRDPFTGKKKLLLISDGFEKSMDGYLRQMVIDQLCVGESVQKISSDLQGKGRQMQEWLRVKTNRNYKIVMIPCKQHVVTVLPETIVISKNMFLSKGYFGGHLKQLVLLMESLFIKKFHIADLAISNVLTLALAKIKPSPVSDIKLASIYSRKYSQQEVEHTISEMSSKYKLNSEQLKQCLKATLQRIDKMSRQSSIFSMAKRFQTVQTSQE